MTEAATFPLQFLVLYNKYRILSVKFMTATQLLLGVLFSSIGLGYFLYGRKQSMTVPSVCGLILIIFPYFVENLFLLGGIGLVLAVLPYFLRY